MNYPIYCEQASINDYFEPINTITNLAFVIAGIVLLIQFRKSNQLELKSIFLSILLIIIGIGSLAWHLHRNNTTLFADSLPIAVFVLSYLFFYLKFTAKKTLHLIALFIGFFIYTFLLIRLLNLYSFDIFDNGGSSYFAAISYFGVLQIYNYYMKIPVIGKSLIILIVFLSSLTFRQIDIMLCEELSFGTHFMWHILNATTLYLMVRLLYSEQKL